MLYNVISDPKTVSIHQLHEINTSKCLYLSTTGLCWGHNDIRSDYVTTCLAYPSNYYTPFMHKCSITHTSIGQNYLQYIIK